MTLPGTPLFQSKGSVPYVPTGYESIKSDIAHKRDISTALMKAGLAGPGADARSYAQLLGSLAQAWVGSSTNKDANKEETGLNAQIKAASDTAETGLTTDAAAGMAPDQIIQKWGGNEFVADHPVMKNAIELAKASHMAKGDPTRMQGSDGNFTTTQGYEDGSVKPVTGGFQLPAKIDNVNGIATALQEQKPGTILPQDLSARVVRNSTTGAPEVNTPEVVAALASQGGILHAPGVAWSGQSTPPIGDGGSNVNPLAPAPGVAGVTGALIKRTHGYTPSVEQGGDNSRLVVDNKIAALAKAVGANPDQPMTPAQFAVFARALPGTEGTNQQWNNPGGVKDSSYARRQPGYSSNAGQYATFATPEAGAAAYTNLLQKNYFDKGQTSIRDIIEGKPVGNQSAEKNPALPPSVDAGPGGMQITAIPGTPMAARLGKATVMTSDQIKAAGLDPSKVYQQKQDGSITTLGPRSDGVTETDHVMGDTTKRGPEYLATLPADHQGLVQSIVDGKFPMSAKMVSKSFLPYFKEASLVAGVPIDATTYARRAKTQTDFAPSGIGGKQMMSFATAINHMYDYAKAVQSLHQGSFVPANAASQAFNDYIMADPKYAAVNSALTPLSEELPRVYNGGTKGGTIPEIAQTRKDWSANQGEASARSMITNSLDKMTGRYGPLINQYKLGMSSNADITKLIDQYLPGAADKMQALQTYAKTGKFPDQGGSNPTLSDPNAQRALNLLRKHRGQ